VTPMPATAKAGAVVLTSATAATVLLSASAIGTATMQAALSQSTCRKSANSNAPPPTPDDNPTLYLISPFFGDSAAMVLGNIAIVLVVIGLHLLVAMIVSVIAPNQTPADEGVVGHIHVHGAAGTLASSHATSSTTSADGTPSHNTTRHLKRIRAFTTTRFPHFSLVMAQMCVQGVQMGAWQLLFDAFNGRAAKFSSFHTKHSIASSGEACALLGVIGLICSVAPTACAVKLRSVLLVGHERCGTPLADGLSKPDGGGSCAAVTVQPDNGGINKCGNFNTNYEDSKVPAVVTVMGGYEHDALDIVSHHSSSSSESSSYVWGHIGHFLGVDAASTMVPLRLMPHAAGCWVSLLKHAGPTHVWHPPEYLRRFATVFNAFSHVPILGPWLLAENWFVSLLVTLVSAADPPSDQFIVCNGLMFFCAFVLLLHLGAVLWLKPFRLPYKNPMKAVCVFFLSVGCVLSAPVLADYDAVQSAQAVNDMLQAFAVMTLGVYEIMIFIAIERSREPDDDNDAAKKGGREVIAQPSVNALPLGEEERSLNLSDVMFGGNGGARHHGGGIENDLDGDEQEMLRIAASISSRDHHRSPEEIQRSDGADNNATAVSSSLPHQSLVRVSSKSALFSSAAQLTPSTVMHAGSQKELSLDSHLHILAAVARHAPPNADDVRDDGKDDGTRQGICTLARHGSVTSLTSDGDDRRSSNSRPLSKTTTAPLPSLTTTAAVSATQHISRGFAPTSTRSASAAVPPNHTMAPRLPRDAPVPPRVVPPTAALQKTTSTPLYRRRAADVFSSSSSSDGDNDDTQIRRTPPPPPPPVTDFTTSSDDDL
jgi:hypothetical protein